MHSLIAICPSCKAKNKVATAKQHLSPKCGRCATALPLNGIAQPLELDDPSLEKLLRESQLPVLIDFYSPTCGPCKTIAPVIVSLTRAYLGRVVVGKIDTGRHRQAANRIQIRGVPTLVFFKNGAILETLVGAHPEHEIRNRIDTILLQP